MSTPTRGELPQGNPDGLDVLINRYQLHPERISYVPNAQPAILHRIDRGMLFLMAFWSIPAMQSFRALLDVLSRLRAEHLELVVVDVDGSPDLSHGLASHGLVCAGWGEVVWVRRGGIIATSGSGLHIECYEPNTRNLLALD